MDGMPLDVTNPVAGIDLIPESVEVFGDQADGRLARPRGRGSILATFLLPEAQSGYKHNTN
jgi:hypothetical protein